MNAEHAGRLRLGLVGYGYWGANLARNMGAAERAWLTCIIDPSPVGQSKARRDYPDVKVYSTLDDALSGEDIDAVVLATPAASHGPLGLQILQSGLHLLVEKPLALSLQEATDLADAARSAGRVLMAGHTFLYSPGIQYLYEEVQKGSFGEILYLAFQRQSLGKIRQDCDVLWNLGPHDVSIADYLLGAQAVAASGTGFRLLSPSRSDVFFGTLTYPGAKGVGLHLSWLDPKKTRRLTLVGSERMVVFDDTSVDAKITIFDSSAVREQGTGLDEYRSVGEFQWATRAGDVFVPRIKNWEPLAAEIDAFIDACTEGMPTPSGPRESLRVVASLEALAKSSLQQGRSTQVAVVE